jgi:hypothetical protein
MAFKARKTPDTMLGALVAANNLRQTEIVSAFFHADTTQKTTGHYSAPVVADDTPALSIGAAPTDTTTVISFTNGLRQLLNRHFADDYAHDTAVSTALADATATDLTTALVIMNADKASYGTHLAAASVHFNNDGTNTISAANATDQTTAITLLTELRTDVGAHVVSAPLGAMIRLVNA